MIARMLEQFADEVSGAREYAECAGTGDSIGSMYREMAQQELGHAEKLLAAIEKEHADRANDPDFGNELFAALDKMLAGRVRDLREDMQ